MKSKVIITFILVTGLVCPALSQNTENDRTQIKQVINKETKYFATGQFDKWKSTWLHSPKALHTGASNLGFHKRKGWETIKSSLKKIIEDTGNNIPVDDLVLKRSNFNYIIDGNMAWVYFMSTDNINPKQSIRDRMESRILKKTDGGWKIMYVNTIDISTYEE